MDDHFKKNALSWGKGGTEWLKRIPAIIAQYEKVWSFTAEAPFELNYNYVAPAKLTGGDNVVLKIGYPKDTEFRSEIMALQTFNGEGICRLLKADPDNAVMLIEHVLPGTPVADLTNDDEATRIIATVIKKLHKPLPNAHGFTTVAAWTTAIPEYKSKYGTTGPLPSNLIDKAESLFGHLVATSDTPILLHGDLHHHNVLLSKDRGWIAIDPKGVAGEPAYELAAMIRNPYDKLKDITNLEPLLRRRLSILSTELSIDAQRIRDWCFAQCVLSAIWNIEGVKGPSHALRVAQTLDKITFL